MKKILCFVFVIAIGFVVNSVSAQYTTPRTGTGVRYDPRNLNYEYATKTDAASATIDTFTVYPRSWQTTYRLVLVDSVCAGNPTLTKSYAGDKIQFIVSAASGTPVLKFVGSNWVTAGNVTMTTRLRSVIDFVFDGAKWVEAGRYTQ